MHAFLFDIDGTLVDSATVIEDAWRQVAAEFGVNAEQIIDRCHGRRDLEVVEEFFEPAVRGQVLTRISALDVGAVTAVAAARGAHDLLDTLADDQWAVVTSGPRELMTARLRAAGLPIPQVLISAEDVGSGKPDPEGFLLAAHALGREPSDCVVVEDSPAGVAAGRAAGATVAAVTTTHPARDLLAADLVLADLTALPGALATFLAKGHHQPG